MELGYVRDLATRVPREVWDKMDQKQKDEQKAKAEAEMKNFFDKIVAEGGTPAALALYPCTVLEPADPTAEKLTLNRMMGWRLRFTATGWEDANKNVL
jgi:predicted glycosyltransferase